MSSYYAFGNVAIDDIVFADGTTMWGVPGGATVWAALGMALWSGRATALAPIGPDYPTADLPAVDFSCPRRLEHTMRHWALYEDDGSRHFVSRRDSEDWGTFSSAAADLEAGPYPYCHLGAMPWARVGELLDALRARGAQTISLDAYDRKLAGVTPDELMAVLERVDVFMPSRQDTHEYLPGLGPLQALRALRARLPNAAVVGVKCGHEGVIVHQAGTPDIFVVPSAATHVVDATGAGDAFCGGFLVGFTRDGDALEGALLGSVSASYAIATTGPAGLVGIDVAAAHQRAIALRKRVTTIPIAAP